MVIFENVSVTFNIAKLSNCGILCNLFCGGYFTASYCLATNRRLIDPNGKVLYHGNFPDDCPFYETNNIIIKAEQYSKED